MKFVVRMICRALAVAYLGFYATARAEAPAVESLSNGQSGKIHFKSANRGTGIDVLYKGKAKYDETISGELALPSGNGKVPAMVIMHGSSGVDGGTSRAWAAFFNQMGVATFIVDSFTPRGIQGTGTDQSQLSYTASGIDGLKALELLATHPRIDASRIGQIGFSRGGVATQESSFEKFRAAVIPGNLKFALHVALYGGCTQYGKTTGVPVVHLVGSDDGYLSVDQCKKVTDMSNALGGNVRLVVYRGVAHGFDRENQKRNYMPNNQTWKDCKFESNLDNLVNQIPGNANASIPELVAYRKTCMTTGVDYGGDIGAAYKAREEVRKLMQSVFQ